MQCKTCGVEKHENDFYANDTTCKDCRKARVKQNRLAKIDYYRAYDRLRGNRQGYEYTREYRKANRNKYNAHKIVGNALRDNKLERLPCEVCGTTTRVHGHHDDYAKPLDVRWLCAAHHRQWHMANGEAKNP